MNKYSQYNEEIFLIEYFKDRKGIVVEIGAADGTNNSNSRRLIENGWEALLIEPNSNNYSKIKNLHNNNNSVRIENCGCSNKTEKQTFFIDCNDEFQQLSTFNPKQVEKCKQMYSCEFKESQIDIIKTSELFEKHNIKTIEFLSIDTESFDRNVLLGIDFNKVNIELICIEDKDAIDILTSNGYQFVHQTIGNLFFKKNNL